MKACDGEREPPAVGCRWMSLARLLAAKISSLLVSASCQQRSGSSQSAQKLGVDCDCEGGILLLARLCTMVAGSRL